MIIPLIYQVLDYARSSNEALKEAKEIVAGVRREKQAAAQLADSVVARMRDAGLIYANEVGEAKEALSRHDRTVEILSNLVEEFRKSQARKEAQLGYPDDLRAYAGSSPDGASSRIPVIGYRYGEHEFSPADAALFRVIGR